MKRRKTEYSRKVCSIGKDSRGFTLMEMVVAVAIIAIFVGILAAFLGTASAGYRSASGGARVQMETQEAVSQIQELLVDANWSVSYAHSGAAVADDMAAGYTEVEKSLTVCSVRDQGATAQCIRDTLIWDPKEKTISHSRSTQDYQKVYPTVTPLPGEPEENTDTEGAAFELGTPAENEKVEFSGAVLARDITDFHADVSGAVKEGVVRFRIRTEKAGRSIDTEHTVYLRNDLPKS